MASPPPVQQARNFFKKEFGYPPVHVTRAPGRLELLGNHTDYNEGLVLAVAVDKYVHIATAPRFDARIELVSSAFPGQRELFWLSDFSPNPARPWANYIKGVLEHARHHGMMFSGFNAAIHSNLPMGAGLGSSAAIEVATILAMRQLHPCRFTTISAPSLPRLRQLGRRFTMPELSRKEKTIIAGLCHKAETKFVGVRCGMLDQVSCLFGKAYHVIQVDFRHLSWQHFPLIGEVSLVVCHSGVKHELAGGQYNELRELCDSAAKKLHARSLRSVELPMLKKSRHLLTDREYECAYHIVGENLRVIASERVLTEDDFAQLGQFMFDSHESSRDSLRNSCPELDLLVELAREHPACYGARLTGGGFGGATVNLVMRPMTMDFMKTIAARYLEKTGRQIEPMLCLVVDGAE
jgi:galactokinase